MTTQAPLANAPSPNAVGAAYIAQSMINGAIRYAIDFANMAGNLVNANPDSLSPEQVKVVLTQPSGTSRTSKTADAMFVSANTAITKFQTENTRLSGLLSPTDLANALGINGTRVTKIHAYNLQVTSLLLTGTRYARLCAIVGIMNQIASV